MRQNSNPSYMNSEARGSEETVLGIQRAASEVKVVPQVNGAALLTADLATLPEVLRYNLKVEAHPAADSEVWDFLVGH
jgi:hypothetical protein